MKVKIYKFIFAVDSTPNKTMNLLLCNGGHDVPNYNIDEKNQKKLDEEFEKAKKELACETENWELFDFMPNKDTLEFYYLATTPMLTAPKGFSWVEIDNLKTLNIKNALLFLRQKAYSPLFFGLLNPTFTMAEIRAISSFIAGRRFDVRNFSKHVLENKILTKVGIEWKKEQGKAHRPANYYRYSGRKALFPNTRRKVEE